MKQTVEEMIRQGFKDIKQWVEEAPTPEAKAYRMQETIKILSSKEPIMHYYRDGLDHQQTSMPEPYDSAFWHSELDRIKKIVESDAK